ncbi:MAG: DNA-3-methyladenine glycosylase I, partial [Anaerolineales bacterium]|nr:DNA-3-methyladenine glycosylase I [Anaerolineales bacterium]
LADPGIIRNRLKVNAAIVNAQKIRELRKGFSRFALRPSASSVRCLGLESPCGPRNGDKNRTARFARGTGSTALLSFAPL